MSPTNIEVIASLDLIMISTTGSIYTTLLHPVAIFGIEPSSGFSTFEVLMIARTLGLFTVVELTIALGV
jgi:hypothetical protein